MFVAMRKIFKSIMLVAATAMAFASCQKEIATPETFSTTLTLTAGVEETKTYLDEELNVLWGTGESVQLYVGSGETSKFVASASTDEHNGNASASFTFNIQGVETAKTYSLGGIYPASVAVSSNNTNPAKYKVQLPATQQSIDGNYDPAAYIMVLKPETVNEIPEEYVASFRRAAALNKISLTNVAEDITSVEITVPEGKYIAGRRNFDLTTGESGEIYDSGTQTNVVKVTGDFKVNEGVIDVWFCSWEVELVADDVLSVKLSSDKNTYTHSVTLKGDESIKFKEGYLNTLTVNMKDAKVEALSTITGKYLIASKTSSGWFLMTPTNGGKYYTATSSVSSASEVTCDDFYEVTDVDDYVWEVAKYDNAYSIMSTSTNKYVAYKNSSNEAYANTDLSDEAKMDIKLDGQVAVIESMKVAGRKLQYNASSPRFAFYTTNQTAVYMIPWVPDTTPRIIVNTKVFNVAYGATTQDISYSLKNSAGTVSVNIQPSTTMADVKTAVSGDKVTVSFAPNTEPTEKIAKILISCNGAQDVEVTITQAAKPSGGETVAEWHAETWANCTAAANTYGSATIKGDLGTWSYTGCSANDASSFNTKKSLALGKTADNSSITSPTFDNGIKGIKFNYFANNTARKVKVTVYENGAIVKEQTITPTSKNALLAAEIQVETTGSTYFKFTPGSSDRRVSVGDIQVKY